MQQQQPLTPETLLEPVCRALEDQHLGDDADGDLLAVLKGASDPLQRVTCLVALANIFAVADVDFLRTDDGFLLLARAHGATEAAGRLFPDELSFRAAIERPSRLASVLQLPADWSTQSVAARAAVRSWPVVARAIGRLTLDVREVE